MPNWNEIFREVEVAAQTTEKPHDAVRHRYLKKFAEVTKRNVVLYYSGWLQKNEPRFTNLVSINDEDMNGFMACFHQLDFTKGLDLFIHTPGGEIAATESIINYIRSKFESDI